MSLFKSNNATPDAQSPAGEEEVPAIVSLDEPEPDSEEAAEPESAQAEAEEAPGASESEDSGQEEAGAGSSESSRTDEPDSDDSDAEEPETDEPGSDGSGLDELELADGEGDDSAGGDGKAVEEEPADEHEPEPEPAPKPEPKPEPAPKQGPEPEPAPATAPMPVVPPISAPVVPAAGGKKKGKHAGKHAAADKPAAAVDEEEPAAAFVAAGFGEIPKKKRRRGLKVFGITLGVLVAIVAIAYVAGAVVFMNRFLPNTEIGERNVSLKTNEEVVALLDEIVPNYRLDVIGGGFSYRATGEDVGLSVDSQGIVDAMHADMNPWQWPLLILQPDHDETAQLNVKYKPASYESDVKAAVEKFNETAKDPVNATITYDKKNDKFIVQPEEAGTKLDADAVLEAMADAIVELEPKAPIGDEQLVQPAVLSTDEKLIEAAELATGMVSADLKLTMGGKNVGEVNGDALSEFITVGDDYQVVFKDEEMSAWIDSLVAGFDTVGTERTYTRADGKAIAVSGGVYGWEIDSEALKNAVLDGIKAGEATEIEVPCNSTAEVFNGANQRDWGNRYIDVDITEQHVRFYGDDGKVIWEADCISGSPDGKHDTVKGVWYVNAKESPSKLIGYENGKKIYETKVQFWMPFEGNGIGFHDATWQPSFGGSMYANGYGSHGCVNLSYDDAEDLYDIIEEGDVVVVHA